MKGATKALASSLMLTIALSVLFVAANSAFADGGTPTTPQSYYGSLTINGENAPVGTGVKAFIDGEDRTYDGPYSTMTAGQYGNTGLSGKFYVSGYVEDNGKTVTFMVETASGYVAAAETGTFNPGEENTNLDLTVTVEEECVDGQTRSCYTGPAGTEGEGICHAGTESCVDGSWSGTCVGEQTPEAETCDGIDNNCDGNTDETWDTLLGTFCSDGVGACYDEGVFACNSAGTDVECTAEAGTPGTETCNGDDDDCDGQTDEGLGTTTCGLGECYHTVDNCVGGTTQTCDPFEGAVAEDTEELCDDGLDNNCNGKIDCDDPSCASFCGTGGDYCIEITGLRILDNSFNEVTEVLPGRMYNVEVTNENVCQDPVTPMQIVEVFEGQTPKNIGTLKAEIDGGDSFVVTIGFTMPSDAAPGTEYTAKAFNWNQWIDQPGEFHILSEPAETSFTVGGAV